MRGGQKARGGREPGQCLLGAGHGIAAGLQGGFHLRLGHGGGLGDVVGPRPHLEGSDGRSFPNTKPAGMLARD